MQENIESYIENRNRFVKKGKGTDFHTAVQHADEFVSDVKKFRSHAHVKKRKIKIKTEESVEKQLGIKVERSNGYEPRGSEPADNNVTSSSQISTVDSWAEEKKTLIENFMTLKAENQTLVKNLKDKDMQLNAANVLNQELEVRLNENDLKFSNKINELQIDLQNSAEKEAKSTKAVSDLKRQNSLIISQNKQLQTGLSQTQDVNSDSDDFYEVESLLDDKLVSEKHYLVRWKGFDSTHDSWERESNLRCGSVLTKYKRAKKLQNKKF